METRAIRLTVFRQAETYIFALDLPNQSLDARQAAASWSVGGMTTLSADVRGQLNETINAVVERLRRRLASSRQKRETSASLLRLGQFLFNFLLPRALQDALRDLPEQNIPIILTTNDTELPWELLHDGSQYLSLKHPIARRLWSSAPVRGKDSPPSSRSFLLIANPTEDLPEADEESDDLMDLFERELISGASLKVLARRRANWLRVSQALGGSYEIIHYSGHAERGVLLLHDGELTTEDIQRTLQGHPFVFLNACWSSRQAEQVKGAEALDYAGVTIRNLAQAFILGGAAGFIGTLWPVFDHSSRQFAAQFYTHVLEGVPVGEALRRTRVQMREQQPDDPIWASFVHYGNPMLTLAKAPPEKRYVTVLVAKLAGLALSVEGLALEAAARLKEQVLAGLKGIVERYDGRLHGPVTDVLAVYFGIPLMTGNEAEVAIRAARDMSQAWGDFRGGKRQATPVGKRQATPLPTLQIGISTGYVLYRASQGEDTNDQITGVLEELAAVGATQAKNGQIVVDQATYQSARTTFSFEPVESAASPRYRVIGHQLPTRSEFVGREEELSQLQGFWRKARAGRRQVICIGGQPGVGKSRLLEAFREQITPSPLTPLPQGEGNHLWISAICHSYDKSQSYHLLGQVIRALAQIEPHDDEASQRRKLGQLVEGEDELALLSTVLGLPFEMPAIQNLTQELAQKLLKKLLEKILKRQAASQPIVLALEDLQSADEDSLTVLEQLVKGRSKRMPLLLLAVYRLDEWEHNWGNAVQANIELEELPSEAQLTMLTNLLDLSPSAELAQMLLKQTGGNPLFIEEYIRFLQESGLLTRSGDSWTANLSDIPLLNKVEAVIQVRLGRLEEQSRHTLHSAAIIGQTFEDQVLYKVGESKRDQTDEEEIIEELSHQRLIEELEEGHNNIFFYAFRHGLVHQIASTLFPDSLLQTMHRLVAQALQVVYRNEEKILSRLAHHYYHSHDRVNAIRYSLRAAKKDAERWANQGAVLWYERVLEKIQSFEEEPATEREEDQGVTPSQLVAWQVEALEGKGDIEALRGKWELALEKYLQVESLTREETRPPHQRADLMRRIGRQYGWGGKLDQGLTWMERGRTLLDPDGGQAERQVLALLDIHSASIFYYKGEFEQVEQLSRSGLHLLRHEGELPTRAEGYLLLGAGLDRQGKSEKALDAYRNSIELWNDLGNEYQVKRVENNLAVTSIRLGQWQDARQIYARILDYLENKVEDTNRLVTLYCNLGYVEYMLGDYDKAIERQQSAMKLADEIGLQRIRALSRLNIAWVVVAWNDWNQAERWVREAMKLQEEHAINEQLADSYCVLAEVAIGRGELNLASLNAEKAYNLAHEQGALAEKGAAQRALGKTLHFSGNFQSAVDHLQRSLKILEGNRFEAARTQRQLAWLSRDMGDETTALSHTIGALTVFTQLGAEGEAKKILSENKLTFHLQQPLSEVTAFCRAEMASAGWHEASSPQVPAPVMTDDNPITLNFTSETHQAVISLTAQMEEVIATLSISTSSSHKSE